MVPSPWLVCTVALGINDLTDGHLLCYTEHSRMIKSDREFHFILQNLRTYVTGLAAVQEHLINLQNDGEEQGTLHILAVT